VCFDDGVLWGLLVLLGRLGLGVLIVLVDFIMGYI
jgi:hypothetical protein